MKFDDASWHYNGDFPVELPLENGGTHIAMYFAWLAIRGFVDGVHRDEYPEKLAALVHRDVPYREYFMDQCDEKLVTEDMTDEGKRFTLWYYKQTYYDDYTSALDFPEDHIYSVEPSWENFDMLAQVLDKRYAEWVNFGRPPGFIVVEE